jgi:ribosomal protein S18 acetylase RimI-like enzyme
MHIEGLKNQQIKNGEFYNNSLTFSSKHVTKTLGHQVTDKAMKVLAAASAAITAATIALTKKNKKVEELSKPVSGTFVSKIATDEDLAQIHKIDLEAFSESYGIYSDFEKYKKDLEEQGVTTYAIKTQSGDVVGYYQLEPIEDGECYIYSIGVKEELRGTRASVAALSLMKEQLVQMAKEQNVDKVALDVDAENQPLVKLYKKFGFEIVETNMVPKVDGIGYDYHMEIDVKKYLAEQALETAKKQPEVDYSQMSDEQIEEIANQIRQNPIFKEKMSETRIDRYTIPLILKVLNCKDNLKPFLINSSIGRVISHTALTGETSSAKAILLDRILSDEKYE